MKSILLKALPHAVAVVLFIILAFSYFSPITDGFDLRQGDINNWRGMSKEISDYRLMTDEEALWTNSMFGGMPAYQISTIHSSNWLHYVDRGLQLGLPGPVGVLFLCMIGVYIFGLCMRINPWVAILGGIGFGFATFNFLFLNAGHTGKVHAVAYIAPAIGGLILAYRGRMWVGAAIFALALGLNITANHFQITYYLAFIGAAVALAETIRLFIKKEIITWVKSSAVLAVAALVAVLPGISNLMVTYEYSEYTTRGKSELTIKADGTEKSASEKEALDEGYILEYNFAKGEAWSTIIPDARGGASGYLSERKDIMSKVPREMRENVGGSNQYWGAQRYTGGAFYYGAFIMFLCLMGFIFTKDVIRWPFLAIGMLSLMLSVKDLTAMNNFFIHDMPMYNKFRDTKMIMVLVQFMASGMAILFIDQLLKDELWLKGRKMVMIGAGALVLVMILLTAAPSLMGDFISSGEKVQFDEMIAQSKDNPQQVAMIDDYLSELANARKVLYTQDATRSLFLFIAAALVVIAATFSKIPRVAIIAIIGIFVLGDLWSVSRRYVNNDKVKGQYQDYVAMDEKLIPFEPSTADNYILEKEKINIEGFDQKASSLLDHMKASSDFKSIKKQERMKYASQFGALNLNSDYRVVTLGDPFSDAQTSYFHKNIGGYHGAKLKIYQEIIEFHLQKEMMMLYDSLKITQRIDVLSQLPVLNMLNTQYIVFSPQAPPIENAFACGNAWFVNNLITTNSADEDIQRLGEIQPKQEATVRSEFSSLIQGAGQVDSTATITLKEYATRKITYTSKSSQNAAAIFSEIYYPAGWKCRIDGTETEYFKANYILRGVVVPAGEHTIEWSFEPQVFEEGSNYSKIGSAIFIILMLAFVFIDWKTAK